MKYHKIGLLVLVVCVLVFTARGIKAVNTDNPSQEPFEEIVLTENEVKEEIIEIQNEKNEKSIKVKENIKPVVDVLNNIPNAVAWLRIPNTDINNAVMQSSDNDYYLRRDEYGNYDVWGCYYADLYSNLTGKENLKQNTVIYGHSQNDDSPNGQKFSELFCYLDIDFLKENPDIFLTVDEEELIFEIFAVFITDIDFYYINPSPSDENFAEFIKTINEKNEFIFENNTITEKDKLLTLSTCSHKYDTNKTGNQRLVVMAKLVDDTTENISVKVNPTPVRP